MTIAAPSRLDPALARLSPREEAAIERLILQARRHGGLHSEELPCGSQCYAYNAWTPYGTIIRWAINDGVTGACIRRGIR